MELDPTRCYRAFVSHDPRFDGRLFAGVTTTGIYCRPVCPVRPAKREHCRFFTCAAAAEAAGFRPCRRCRPEASPGAPAWLGTSALVARAFRLIDAGALDAGDVETLAGRLGVGARQLRRLFAEHVGASPARVARARRAHFARALLDATDLPMHAVAFGAGFRSVRQFNHAVRTTFRASPTALRARRRPGGPGAGLVLRLAYRPPLDWPALCEYLALRATPGVEVVTGAAYRRTIPVGDGAGVVEVRPDPDGRHLRLRVDPPATTGLMALVARARRLFDLDAAPDEIARVLRRSAVLRPLVEAAPGRRVPGAWDGFELAVRAIIGQQVTVRGATTLTGRLVARLGRPVDVGVGGLDRLFPTPAAIAAADLAGLGIPGARRATLRALAAAVARGELALDGTRPLDEAVARLRAIRGLGPWTAEYVAMRALGEPDAFPAGDLGLRRAAGDGAGPLPEPALRRIAEAWRPWRAYAAMHLWTGARPAAAARRSA